MSSIDPSKIPTKTFEQIKHLCSELKKSTGHIIANNDFSIKDANEYKKIQGQLKKNLDQLNSSQKSQKEFLDLEITQVIDESDKLVKIFDQRIQEFKLEKEKKVLGLSLFDVKSFFRSRLRYHKNHLSNEAIEKAYKAALYGQFFQRDFEKMLEAMDLVKEELSKDYLETILSCYIVLKRPPNNTIKLEMFNSIFDSLLTLTRTKLAAKPGYDKYLSVLRNTLVNKMLLTDETINLKDITSGFTLKELLYLKEWVPNEKTILYEGLDVKINFLLHERFSKVRQKLYSIFEPQKKLREVEKLVGEAMGILYLLSADIALEKENFPFWAELEKDFSKILKFKLNQDEVVQDLIDRIFQKFNVFIEDGLISYLFYLGEPHNPEYVTQKMYGRSKKEMERLKAENRKAVCEKIEEFASEIKAGKTITIKMLTELNRVNNQNIVPKFVSEIRDNLTHVRFGKRVGLISEDLKPALEKILKRATEAIKRYRSASIASTRRFQVEVAQLHNKILDIHPFLDRNGSTCLLFAELMMCSVGKYRPPKTRQSVYYKKLRRIVGRLGSAVIFVEHYKIAHVEGHYKSKAIELTEEKRKEYERLLKS